MQPHRNAGAKPAHSRAATPPPAGSVHGLGVVDALRIHLEPAQLPWLAAEIGTFRYSLEDEFGHQRAHHDELSAAAREHRWRCAREAEQELERRAYQLQALAMIREQLPISGEAAAGGVASPSDEPADDDASAPDHIEGPVAVVGPAALMTALIRGATRNVAHVLGEAVRGPTIAIDEHTDRISGWRGPDLPRPTPTIAERLRAMAAAAQAFTGVYLDILVLQGYSFDLEHQPVHADELE